MPSHLMEKEGEKIMDITNEAKEYIHSLLEEQQAKGLRIYAIEGCCGPQIGLSIDMPEESDVISVINDVQVAVARQAEEFVKSLTLDFETEGDQSGLVMIGAPNNC